MTGGENPPSFAQLSWSVPLLNLDQWAYQLLKKLAVCYGKPTILITPMIIFFIYKWTNLQFSIDRLFHL